jgi:hypothetical protein
VGARAHHHTSHECSFSVLQTLRLITLLVAAPATLRQAPGFQDHTATDT